MQQYFVIGATPSEEECAQVGQPGYRQQALQECRRFIALLRQTFGPEPEGAQLRIMAFEHDFGQYYEVVCDFDPDLPASVAYARRCDDETPSTWDAPPAASPKTCPTCGSVLQVLLFLGVQPDGYVCAACQLHYNDALQPLARILGGEPDGR